MIESRLAFAVARHRIGRDEEQGSTFGQARNKTVHSSCGLWGRSYVPCCFQMKHAAIWARFAAHDFAVTDKISPVTWLSDELGISASSAALAIEEYRRFLYLLEVADRPLSPPPVLYKLWSKFGDRGPHDNATAAANLVELGLDEYRLSLYAATRILYLEEFGRPLLRKMWPSVPFMRVGIWALNILPLAAIFGFSMLGLSFFMGLDALNGPVYICMSACSVSLLWILVLGPWGELKWGE